MGFVVFLLIFFWRGGGGLCPPHHISIGFVGLPTAWLLRRVQWQKVAAHEEKKKLEKGTPAYLSYAVSHFYETNMQFEVSLCLPAELKISVTLLKWVFFVFTWAIQIQACLKRGGADFGPAPYCSPPQIFRP